MATLDSYKQQMRVLTAEIIDKYEQKTDYDEDNRELTSKDFVGRPFQSVRITLLCELLIRGYQRGRTFLSDISERCNHNLDKFNGDSKVFTSFIIQALFKQINIMKKMEEMSGNHRQMDSFLEHVTAEEDIIFNLINEGICKNCAHLLAMELFAYLSAARKFEPMFSKITMILFKNIVEYPCLVRYFINHTNLWKHIMECIANCCTRNGTWRGYVTENDTENGYLIKTLNTQSYTNLEIMTALVLRNGFLMRKGKYWRKKIPDILSWCCKTYERRLNTDYVHEITASFFPLLEVQSIIILFFHYNNKKKLKKKYEQHIDHFKMRIRSIHNEIDVECLNRINEDDNFTINFEVDDKKLVKESLSQLIETMDGESSDWADNIVRVQGIAWEMMKQNMECLWRKCDKQAKDFETGRLHKCKRCRVARYCSKSCQKRDWKYGYHKELCDKFVRGRKTKL